MSGVVSRFAPSPTGRLHLGHAYSAIMAHDFARSADGRFLLRIEDIDKGRSRPKFVDGIIQDLTWLGLTWDGAVMQQSSRRTAYDAALDRLIDMDIVYPCFCTRKDIAAAADAPHGPDSAQYPGTCRALDDMTREQRRITELHAWRLNAAKAEARTGKIFFMNNGEPVRVDARLNGDVVIARKDAGTSYHLACSIDDAYQSVTNIVRGTDLLASTHVHRILQELLGLPVPDYHHHALLLGPDGERLAKRNGGETLADLRAAGVTAVQIRAQIGLTP